MGESPRSTSFVYNVAGDLLLHIKTRSRIAERGKLRAPPAIDPVRLMLRLRPRRRCSAEDDPTEADDYHALAPEV